MAMIHLDSENFNDEVKNSKMPIIIDFWAPWCGPCQMMGVVFEKLSNQYRGKIKFLKLNTDEYSEFAVQYQIQGIPALVFINKGKEIDRIVGFLGENELKKKIDKILEGIK